MTHPHLLLRCGCDVPYDEHAPPRCPTHGAVGIARTVHMPKPRIRGVATGPLVQTTDLPAWGGRLAGSPET